MSYEFHTEYQLVNAIGKIEVIDPWQYITISSVCMAVFNLKFLKIDTIANMHFTSKDNYSRVSIIWLEWLMHKS